MTSGARSNCCCTGATTRISLQTISRGKSVFSAFPNFSSAVTGTDGRRRGRPRVYASRAAARRHAGDDKALPNCLVVLVRAKKLKRLEKYAETPGTTDPTCMSRWTARKRSRTVENQLNLHWNQSFKFNDIEDLKLDRDTQHCLHVDIFDTDADGETTSIASCKVPCFKFRDRKPHRAWHWLNRENEDAQSAGKVELVCRWVHDPALILPVDLANVYEDEGSEVQQPNEITVHIVRCRQFIRTSRTLASKDTSNPFVRVSTTFESKRTKVARRTVAPVYQKRFSFEGRQGDHDLLVEVFDSSSGDLCGNQPVRCTTTRPCWIRALRNLRPSSRRRVDGVEADATSRTNASQNFDLHTGGESRCSELLLKERRKTYQKMVDLDRRVRAEGQEDEARSMSYAGISIEVSMWYRYQILLRTMLLKKAPATRSVSV